MKNPRRPRAFRNNRAHVEKLEDRILLSAEALIQQQSSDDNKDVQLPAVDSVSLAVKSLFENSLELNQLAPAATKIDLSKIGSAGAAQNSALTWNETDKVLNLNERMLDLVLNLGSGANDVILTTLADGKLRLSGDSIQDIVFAQPTHLLGISGGSRLPICGC